jgi:lipopolysaccharide biosynthesis glycosyltransferase
MLILENIDELFEKKHLSAVRDKFPGNENWDGLNSGLLVIEPNMSDYKNLIKLVPVVAEKFKNFGDQNVINEYVAGKYTEEFWLDDKYNMLQGCLDWYIKNQNYTFKKSNSTNNIKIIHFIGGRKPWMYEINLKNNIVFVVKEVAINLLRTLIKGKNKKYYIRAMSMYRKYLLKYNSLK